VESGTTSAATHAGDSAGAPIEKAGSGILDLIALCADAGLLPPEFLQEGGQFIQRIWRLEAGGPSIRSVIDWGEGSTMSMLIALAARPSREA